MSAMADEADEAPTPTLPRWGRELAPPPSGGRLGGGTSDSGPLEKPRSRGFIAEAIITPLILSYQEGDLSALAQLYTHLEPAIHTFVHHECRAQLHGVLGKDDLLQQSWVITADLARRWRQVGSFAAYFLRSFPLELHRYVVRAQQRSTKLVRVITIPHDELVLKADLIAAPTDSNVESIIDQEACLNEIERQIVLLRAEQGLSFTTIAQLVGISRSAAHRAYQRARLSLSALCTQLVSDPSQMPARPEARPTREPIHSGRGTLHVPLPAMSPPAQSVERLDEEIVLRVIYLTSPGSGIIAGRRHLLQGTGWSRTRLAAAMNRLRLLGIIAAQGATRPQLIVEPTLAAALARLGNAITHLEES